MDLTRVIYMQNFRLGIVFHATLSYFLAAGEVVPSHCYSGKMLKRLLVIRVVLQWQSEEKAGS